MARRTRAVVKAADLGVSLWTREGTDFLGSFDGATWSQDVTEVQGRSEYPWQEMGICERLDLPSSAELMLLALTLPRGECLVTFSDGDGQSYSGRVVLQRSSSVGARFLGQGAFQLSD